MTQFVDEVRKKGFKNENNDQYELVQPEGCAFNYKGKPY